MRATKNSCDPRILGRILRQVREEAHITQKEVADHLGVVRPIVSKIEAGLRRATEDELKRICCFLGVEVQSILDQVVAQALLARLSPAGVQVLDRLLSLPIKRRMEDIVYLFREEDLLDLEAVMAALLHFLFERE